MSALDQVLPDFESIAAQSQPPQEELIIAIAHAVMLEANAEHELWAKNLAPDLCAFGASARFASPLPGQSTPLGMVDLWTLDHQPNEVFVAFDDGIFGAPPGFRALARIRNSKWYARLVAVPLARLVTAHRRALQVIHYRLEDYDTPAKYEEGARYAANCVQGLDKTKGVPYWNPPPFKRTDVELAFVRAPKIKGAA